MELDIFTGMMLAFAAGMSWERDSHFQGRESGPDSGDRHESTLLSWCFPGQPISEERRRYVVECLKAAFRHGQACERELRAKQL